MASAFSRYAIGMICCLVALAACIAACVLTRRRRQDWPVLVPLTVLQLALLVDMLFHVRWLVHNELAGEFRAHRLYEGRVGPQHLALLVVAVAASAGIWLLLKSLRGRRGAQMAWCGMILWVSTWLAQVISLHSMDVFLHRSLAHVTVRDVAWIVSSLLISCGVLLDARRAPTAESRRSVQTR